MNVNVNNLTRSQLKAQAEVTVVRDFIWRERIGGDDDADTQEEPLTREIGFNDMHTYILV